MNQPTTRFAKSALFLVLVLVSATLLLHAQAPETPLRDRLTRLGGQLERGEATLEYRDGHG